MCSNTEANTHVLVVYTLTYYKATFRANHVPRSVVLHQYGFRVVGTLNSGKSQTISTTKAKQQLIEQQKMHEKDENSTFHLLLLRK